MRITSVTIKNFKGIDEHGVRVDFAPITMLFGPNNAGKSTVIQALYLAREVFCHPHVDLDRVEICGKGIDLGTFKDYVHRHDLGRMVSITLAMQVDELPSYLTNFDRTEYAVDERVDELLNLVNEVAVEIGIRWNAQHAKAELSELAVYINNTEFTRLHIDSHTSTTMMDRCNVAPFITDEDRSRLQEQIAILYNNTQGFCADYNAELHDFFGEVNDSVPALLQRAADVTKLVVSLGGPNSILLLENRPIQIYVDNRMLPDFDSNLPLEAADLFILDNQENYTVDVAEFASCRALLSSLILGPCKLTQNFLNSVLYVGPLRELPDRDVLRVLKPSSTRWAEGLAAWDMLATASDAQLAEVNCKLHGPGSLETGYTVKRMRLTSLDLDGPLALALRQSLLEDFDENSIPLLREFLNQPPEIRLALHNEFTGVDVEPHDVGVGIGQVLPVVTASVFAKSNTFVVVEQPELHIHPKMQVGLGDVFINTLNSKDNAPIFLLETHSEHLLLRLLRRIRHTYKGDAPEALRLTHTGLAVHWVGGFEGRTEILRLGLDEDGSFNTPWPEGFFDERGEELFG